MNEQQTAVLADAQTYVRGIFEAEVSPDFRFHNIDHVEHVVAAAEELAAAHQLTDDDRFSVLLAAWFHDTGYRSGSAARHEQLSIEIARSFMQSHGVLEPIFSRVIACIDATRMPQSPKNLIEQIICDADLAHLGTEGGAAYSKLLRQEINLTKGVHIGKKEWAKHNLEFMQSHQYFTEYAKQKFGPVKQDEIRRLLRKTGQDLPEDPKIEEPELPELEPVAEEVKPTPPGRGIETMFRTTSANHFTLSSMADSKANIMISVNSIIMTITVSVLLDKLSVYPYLMVPTAILICVCLATIVFSILATRPNVNGGVFTREDIESKKTNLLFFGNFHKMTLDDYQWGMKEMMKDRDYLYGSMVKDIYFLGVVLARKYKYLRISYNIFMFGLVIAMAAFAISITFAK